MNWQASPCTFACDSLPDKPRVAVKAVCEKAAISLPLTRPPISGTVADLK